MKMVFLNRRSNRLPGYDYSSAGAYFITVCTEDRSPVLGEIVEGGGLDAPCVRLSEIGMVVQRYIVSGNMIPGITVDKYVVMPNHVHMILLVNPDDCNGTSRAPSPTEEGGTSRAPSPTEEGGTSRAPSPTNKGARSPANALIPHFMSTFKRFCHRDVGRKLFQRSYHDHVIRNTDDYIRIWQYIDTNPARWCEDCFYTPAQD